MQAATNTARIAEELTVPNPKPPCSWVLVRRSPAVAPRGRVKTKAAQNSAVLEIRERYLARTIRDRMAVIRIAPPSNPRPELSARKSPKAVPSVFEMRIAAQ